jgi:CRP-like cAMP-binding protein
MKETNTARSGGAAPSELGMPLKPPSLAALKAIQAIQVRPRGFDFFMEGEPPHGVYLLYAGCVELSMRDCHDRKKSLGLAHPGSILGLSAVLSGKHHEETAVATVLSEAGFVKGQDFLYFLDDCPEAAFWIVQLLSDQVASALEHLSCMALLPSSGFPQ